MNINYINLKIFFFFFLFYSNISEVVAQDYSSFIETADENNQRVKIKTIYDELMLFYDGQNTSVINGDANQYDVVPGFTTDSNTGVRTYTIGQYKPLFKQYMLKWWEFYKAIAQRPDPILRDFDNVRAELATLILSSNRQISHFPSQPQDMDDDTFALGNNGCQTSNLFAAGSKYWFHKTLKFNFTEGKTKDDGVVQIPSLVSMGHRWNGLWKNTSSVGIGYNYFNNYTTAAYRVIGNSSSSDGFQGFSAFPHGYYPIQAELEVKNQFDAQNLFNKQYPQGAKGDLFATSNTATGYHNLWTIQQISSHTINNGQSITVTIRNLNEQGPIINQLTCNAGDEIVNPDGSFLRIKTTPYAGGWTFTMKPSHGVLSGAVTDVMNSEDEKVFHITVSGPGISPNQGSNSNLSYRIIYYDIDTHNYGGNLAVDNQEHLKFFNLSPNPTKDKLYIKSKEVINRVEVFNSLGQRVLVSRDNNVNVKDLANGIYVLKVFMKGNKIGIKRFIKE